LHSFSYDVTQGGTTFSDPDGDALTYSIDASRFNAGLRVNGTRIVGTLDTHGWVDVEVTAADGRGGAVTDAFRIVVTPNSPPVLQQPNMAVLVTAGTTIDFDPTQSGSAFSDSDGDVVTYEVAPISPLRGMSVSGSRVLGTLQVGELVTFAITARDAFGGSAVDVFSIAVPLLEPGLPTLPAIPYVYADEELPLPYDYWFSRQNVGPFFDTTPADNPTSNVGAALGRVLFYDKRLSLTNTHSCGSCHVQEKGFATAERFDVGAQGVPLRRNAMGLANVRYSATRRFFLDGRALSLEALALMPIQEPAELGNFLPLLEAKLASTSFYPRLFEEAFGTPDVTSERIAKALAQFLRSIISYRTRFDAAFHEMEQGDVTNPFAVLTSEEIAGSELFLRFCGMCHQGNGAHTKTVVSNNGLDVVSEDPGSGGGNFRSASLRNIAVTAPYMHDGRFFTLREVVDHYDHGVQASESLHGLLRDATGAPLRLQMTEADKSALEAFLNTLTDEALLSDPKFSDPFR
jgi:cytochrome c peroxidase